jgi:hypothetical protein
VRKYNFPNKKYRVGKKLKMIILYCIWIVEPFVLKKSFVRKEGLPLKGKPGLNLA